MKKAVVVLSMLLVTLLISLSVSGHSSLRASEQSLFRADSPSGTKGLLDDPNLISITIFERTDSLIEHVYAKDDPRLRQDIDQNPPAFQFDFMGTPLEYYDVFVSDQQGNLDIHGRYLTIECYFNKRRGGVANNIDAVRLDFRGGAFQWANRVGSYQVGFGPFPRPDGDVQYAIGAVDLKHTLMGYGYSRITLGFSTESTIVTYLQR